MPKYRIYADNTVICEDEFLEQDNSQPYYDDYSEHDVPEGKGCLRSIPKILKPYIKADNGGHYHTNKTPQRDAFKEI